MTEQAKITEEYWQDQKFLRFQAGGYEGVIIPGIGGQVVALTDLKRGLELLRAPDWNDFETFKGRPQVYGMALLFPPNRIEDGKFPIAGRIEQFPTNDAKDNNHIHGFVRLRPWKVVLTECLSDQVNLEVVLEDGPDDDAYGRYQRQFRFKLRYELSQEGLKQILSITNRGSEALPVGVGFHTSFRIPFTPAGKAEDYRIKASVGEKWEIAAKNLPTGKRLPLTKEEAAYRSEEGVLAQGSAIYDHCTAQPITVDGRPFHGAIIEDRGQRIRMVYEVGPLYQHWAIWNDDGHKGFICPEPMSWVTNAPNLDLPADQTGYRLLEPGQTWEEWSRISAGTFA